MKNVCFLFGVNGVGKTALARAIADRLAGTAVVGASELLRAALGGATREALEAMPAETKHRVKREALLAAFAASARAPLVVCDTHLVVPIRRGGVLRLERMWDEAYAPHGRAFLLVSAPEADILARRRDDAVTGRRVRTSCDEFLSDEIRVQEDAFHEAFSGRPDAMTVENVGPIADVACRVIAAMNATARGESKR